MVTYKWFKKEVPKDLKVRQVYGIVFDDAGQVLLRVDQGIYKLTGGKPESFDKDYEDTLRREYLEELNIELDDVHYLGYLEVTENDDVYAQVRMIAKVKRIGESRADLDSGKVYERFMANQENVKKYLNYPDIAGTALIDDAIEMANEVYDFQMQDTEEYFLE